MDFLEPRRLLSGIEPQIPVAASVAPAWFQTLAIRPAQHQTPQGTSWDLDAITWQGQTVRMVRGEWIVALSADGLSSVRGVGDVASLWAGAPFPVRVLGGVGRVGTVVIDVGAASGAAVADWFARQPSVARVEPDVWLQASVIPNDPSFGSLWGLNNTGQSGGTVDADIDAPEAWDLSTGSSSVVVGIIDTGIDYNHPDLKPNMWVNAGEIAGNGIDDDGNGFVDDVYGYDFINGDSDPIDDHGHGTHVAGTIGAKGNNSLGVTGVNWSVKLMALKMMDASGSGPSSAQIAAVNYVTMMKQRGVNLVSTNNSYGGDSPTQAGYDAIKGNGDQGVLFVAAAGNAGANNDDPSKANYPSSYTLDNIIAVAATDRNDSLASWSSYGKSSVDLAAPGVSIYSTARNGGYVTLSGTSMATPHVAGAVALAAAYRPDATAAQIKAAILNSVDKLSVLTNKTVTGGRLNLRRALDALADMTDPTVSISNASVTEGNSGAVTMSFSVTLSKAGSSPVVVSWTTADGTALAGFDYVAANGTLTFASGELSKPISVAVIPDILNEDDETIVVNLSNPVGAMIVTGQGVGTIINDDPLPSLSISDGTVTEGNSGIRTGQIAISLNKASGRDVTVTYKTLADPNGANPATPDVDYRTSNGTLTIPAGTTRVYAPIDVYGDLKNEPNETFLIQLTVPVNATLTRATAVATIRDDDPIPTVKVVDSTVSEGNTGTTPGKVKVTLSNALDVPTSVDFVTAPAASGDWATSGVDYTPASGTLVIPAGSLVGYIIVPIIGDLAHEPNEVFRVNISNPVNGVIGQSSATVTIKDDDPYPTITIKDASRTEGNSGLKAMSFTVSLSNALDVPISVDYRTADATSGAKATAGADYVVKSGTLTIPAGSRSGTISIDMIGDLTIEPDEVFRVLLSNPVNATIAVGAATGTIVNDDAIPTLTIADTSIVEGNTGTKKLRFVVALSNAIDHDVSIDFKTVQGTATEGADYLGTSGTLVIASGGSFGYIYVTVYGDYSVEPDETFFLKLSNISGGNLGNSQAVGTIMNDD